MFDPNVTAVLERIGPGDRVLDVGGWARCFNRADYVIDVFPYETRGRCYLDGLGLGPQGGEVERFSAETWVVRDLCDHEPWPFPDQFFDYCTCSHTLEDLRDPIWVCREMSRVAKAGYVEVPSAAFEMTRGREPGVPVGLSHHRWIVLEHDGGLRFCPKNHYIHGDRRLSLPGSFGAALPDERQVTWLFWEGEVNAKEGWLTREQLESMVRAFGTFPENEADRGPDAERLALELTQTQQELFSARAEIAALTERLQAIEGIGPTALSVAGRLQRLAHAHPRLSGIVRRVIRAA